MSVTVYKKTALTGGGASALDGINGTGLLDGDLAFVMLSNVLYVYILDADSAAAESSPTVISPDANAGNKRWILQNIRTPLVEVSAELHVTAATHLDEAVSMSSKAPAASPTFTGVVSRGMYVREFVVEGSGYDSTLEITLTYGAYDGAYVNHVLEILAAVGDTAANVQYSSIVRYSVTCRTSNPAVTDMTHDLIGGVTEGAAISGNVLTVTLTFPGAVAIDLATIFVRDVSSASVTALSTVTMA